MDDAPARYLIAADKSPKSTAFPADAIVTYSILSVLTPPVTSPPPNTTRVELLPAAPFFVGLARSPKSIKLPRVAIVADSI